MYMCVLHLCCESVQDPTVLLSGQFSDRVSIIAREKDQNLAYLTI